MRHWKLSLALAGVFGIAYSWLAWAGQVPNPINAPASVSANALAYWTGTQPQNNFGSIATSNNAILATNGSGVPTFTTALPSGITIPSSDCPLPTNAAVGCVEANAATSHQWLTNFDTNGIPHLLQPAFSDLSGSIAPSQLIAPTTSAFGGIYGISCSAHQWVDVIPVSAVQPTCAQPAVADLSGLPVTVAQGGTNATTGAGAANNLSHEYVACQAAPNNSHTGDVSLTQMNTMACKLPANTLAVGDVIEVRVIWGFTGTAGTKTIQWLLNTSNGTGGSGCFSATPLSSTLSYASYAIVGVTGASTEKCVPFNLAGTSSSASAVVSLSDAVNADMYINFVGQLGNSADTMTLVAYRVTVGLSAGN